MFTKYVHTYTALQRESFHIWITRNVKGRCCNEKKTIFQSFIFNQLVRDSISITVKVDVEKYSANLNKQSWRTIIHLILSLDAQARRAMLKFGNFSVAKLFYCTVLVWKGLSFWSTRPVVITIFTQIVRTYVFLSVQKLQNQATITAGRVCVSWPSGSLVTPVLFSQRFIYVVSDWQISCMK